MEKTLQYEEATKCLGLPSTSPGNHRLNGPKADHALTFTLDLSMGANQSLDSMNVRLYEAIFVKVALFRMA